MNTDLFLLYTITFFTVSGAMTFSACPAARWLSFLIGAIDNPDGGRKRHAFPTPRLGGIAVAAGFILPFLASIGFENELLRAIALGGAVILLMGVTDDVRGMAAPMKLILQISAALIAFLSGIRITSFRIGEMTCGTGILSLPLTILVIVAITNSFNLIDGIDGLSAGEGAVCSFFLSVLSLVSGDLFSGGVSAALCGAAVGFLPYNLKKKKLFLGDSGAQLIGFIISILSAEKLSGENAVPLFALLFILAYPLSETAASFIRRMRRGKNPMRADRGHFHYRLIDMGIGLGQACSHLLIVSAVFCMAGICLALGALPSLVIILLIGVFTVRYGRRLLFSEKFIKRTEKASDKIAQNIDHGKGCAE